MHFLLWLTAAVAQAQLPAITFVEQTTQAGFAYGHGYLEELGVTPEFHPERIAGGVAAGDFDRDGWVDLYVVRGDIGANLLFRNLGDGTFEEVGVQAGVAISGAKGAGPTFGDWDGDGWLDLFIGGIKTTTPRLFRNLGNEQADGPTFVEVTAESGVVSDRHTFSCSLGDFDRDQDLDLLLTHWGFHDQPCIDPCGEHLWRNDGDGTFTSVDAEVGITGYEDFDYSFTGNFADINADGWPDILMASDFGLFSKLGRSRIYLNDGDGSFTDITDPGVITDENGMGAAVGDYDNDGDLDWFVSSIYDAPPVDADLGFRTGNRLYRNLGSGPEDVPIFEDVSEPAGVRLGYWGWASCFADFDNDSFLDIFHVNGWRNEPWLTDPSRLFHANGDGTFTEISQDIGLNDTGNGRGLVCFDYDRDGDIDLFVTNFSGPPALYRNDGGHTAGHFLSVQLMDAGGSNFYGIGAWIHVTTGDVTQLREVRAGSNYGSQQPLAVHFGLADAEVVDRLTIRWPDGLQELYKNVEPNQFLTLQPGRLFADGFESGNLSGWSTAGPKKDVSKTWVGSDAAEAVEVTRDSRQNLSRDLVGSF